ncbi:hypothetical protein [Pimelobacter simplex]|uniref:hypothetical protein n=1 Tax=Nocardioides simplex TaxID=2045 RepID=UPI003AAEA317
MRTPRLVAALGAAVLLPVSAPALVAPAHADETFTGSVSDSSPPLTMRNPYPDTDRCGTPADGSFTVPAAQVSFVSQSDGPRRFAVRPAGAAPSLFLVVVFRNGVCVAADAGPDDNDPNDTDMATSTTDLENVSFRKGDRVVVRIAAPAPVAWRLDVTQPGTANAAAAGKGSSYVKLPYQVSCASKKATVQVAGKAKARKIKSITFTAGGKKVAAVKGVRARQNIKLKGIPSSATSIKAVVKLKGGGKAKVTRAYSVCR